MTLVTEPEHKRTAGVLGRAGVLQVATAVFWSFLGIRKRAAHENDAVTITPLQVIVAGIIGAVILVLSLVFLVGQITG